MMQEEPLKASKGWLRSRTWWYESERCDYAYASLGLVNYVINKPAWLRVGTTRHICVTSLSRIRCSQTQRRRALTQRLPTTTTMARRDRSRSRSPDMSYKRVRSSYQSPRSPSPTRRNRPNDRSRYDDRERDRDRERRDRDRDRDRRDRDRYADDKRRDSYRYERDRRDDRRDDRRPRSRSRDRRDREHEREHHAAPKSAVEETRQSTPAEAAPVEDEKVRKRREKLEAWKKDNAAKKALDEAKAKAMALAGKTGSGE